MKQQRRLNESSFFRNFKVFIEDFNIMLLFYDVCDLVKGTESVLKNIIIGPRALKLGTEM